MKDHNYAIILAGGVGSRFWPMSRQSKPKQFLDILNVGETFIQSTYNRLEKLFLPGHIYVVTHTDYADTIKEQLHKLPVANILIEPQRRNTTAAIAYAAYKLKDIDPEANLLIAPSDHYISDTDSYVSIIRLALTAALQNKLVTIGITPTRPDTGYGYIQYDTQDTGSQLHKVLRFTEKPEFETAIKFITGGDYLWNSGMFVWRAETIIKALSTYCPAVHALFHNKSWNTPDEPHIINDIYSQCPSVSIDYSVMEKADNVYVIPGQFGWSDVGTWASLHSLSEKTAEENVLPQNNLIIDDCVDCMIKSDAHKATVIKGLKDYIVVDTKDALLIYPKSKEQEIREVLVNVKLHMGESYL